MWPANCRSDCILNDQLADRKSIDTISHPEFGVFFVAWPYTVCLACLFLSLLQHKFCVLENPTGQPLVTFTSSQAAFFSAFDLLGVCI
jgi:hypothetical protein